MLLIWISISMVLGWARVTIDYIVAQTEAL